MQGQNHIWLCGSYYGKGVPLLENAVVSAMNTVKAIQKIDTCELEVIESNDKKNNSCKYSWLKISPFVVVPIFIAYYFLKK